MSWLAIAAITVGAIVGASAVLFVVLLYREGWREGSGGTPEDEMFGTLRQPEPPAPPYGFIE